MKVNVQLDTEELRVPQGWEVVGVRSSKRGEWYLSYGGELAQIFIESSMPLVIVRKCLDLSEYQCTVRADEVYGKDYNPPDGYEVVGFRTPKRGETYVSGVFHYINTACEDYVATPRLIVKGY